jgi:cysteinyl-tRNA synthetase
MEFGVKELDDADKALDRIDQLVRRARLAHVASAEPGSTDAFRDAMDDDFDTPAGLAVLFDLVREANIAIDTGRDDAAALVATVREIAGALGIEPHDDVAELDDEIRELVERRDEARARRDFAEADRLRDQLRERGIVLEDTPDGTVWRREE